MQIVHVGARSPAPGFSKFHAFRYSFEAGMDFDTAVANAGFTSAGPNGKATLRKHWDKWVAELSAEGEV